jgi:ATP:ADP antiporter, AAA family
MRDKLRTLLEIKSGEESMVSMLLTQSVFLGIFIGAFDITAHSLLLSTFDEKMLARGYIVSGIAGIFITSAFSWSVTRFRFRNLAVINLLVITILTLSLWYLLFFSPERWITFLLFVLLVPFNIAILFGFWGTTARLFSLKKRKVLSGLVEAGPISGIIIISFIIPVLISFNFQVHNMLLVSAASLFIATVFQEVIGKRGGLIKVEESINEEHGDKRFSFITFFRDDSYTRSIAVFILFSLLVSFFIQYLFLAAVRELYPVAENLASFLGIFTGGMSLLMLVVSLVVFPYILKNWGIRICLVITPVLIAVLTALSIVTGILMGYGPEAPAGLIVFFLLLALTRIISKSLIDSVELPSFNVIYLSVKNEIRSVLQSRMTGTFNEIAIFVSGFVLTGLGLFGFIRLIHFSLVLEIVCLLWLFVGLRIFREYRKTLIRETENAVNGKSPVNTAYSRDILKNRFSASINFHSDYFRLISGDFSVINESRNRIYFEELIEYAFSQKDINLLPVLKKAANNSGLDEGIRHHSTDVAEFLQNQSVSMNTGKDKIYEALKTLSGSRMPQATEILRLIRDKSMESKKLAICMIGKFRIADLMSEVCSFLGTPGLEKDAYQVLRTFGPEAENELVRLYLITSGNTRLSKTILQLLGSTCTSETAGFLFSRLWSNSRQLKEVAADCLIKCRFKPSDDEKKHLDQLTSEIIGIITWYISAKISLERDNDIFLLEKINHEIERWNKLLIDILSITYGYGAVALIYKYLDAATTESVTYALDMAGILVSDSIRAKLVSLLDVVPDEVKLKNLTQFFPGEIQGNKKLIEDILNRDYNLISLWTKACTLRSLSRIESDELTESVTALLFSPEELIQEESAALLERSKPDIFKSVSGRLPESIKTRLDNLINRPTAKEEFLFEKVQFLSGYFGESNEDDLLSVASELKYLINFGSESVKYEEGCLIWPLNSENRGIEVHVVYKEDIGRISGKYNIENDLSFYILPLSAVEEYHFQYPEKSQKILKYIDIHEE